MVGNFVHLWLWMSSSHDSSDGTWNCACQWTLPSPLPHLDSNKGSAHYKRKTEHGSNCWNATLCTVKGEWGQCSSSQEGEQELLRSWKAATPKCSFCIVTKETSKWQGWKMHFALTFCVFLLEISTTWPNKSGHVIQRQQGAVCFYFFFLYFKDQIKTHTRNLYWTSLRLTLPWIFSWLNKVCWVKQMWVWDMGYQYPFAQWLNHVKWERLKFSFLFCLL